jgi:DNA-binding HxlR family transcriptional regulator
MARNGDEGFDSAKAELFEQLGHPLRIKIIEELYASPLSFSALKSKTGITSNGHLNFHLAKLKELVSTNEAGEYYLTDTGRDSMQIASMIDWQKHSRRSTTMAEGLGGPPLSRSSQSCWLQAFFLMRGSYS